MISSDHHHLDPGRAALLDGVWNGGSGRIDHGYESEEPQVLHRWPATASLILRIERETFGKGLRVQLQVAKTEDALAQPAQLAVGAFDPTLYFLVQREGSASVLGENGRTAVDDPLRGAFHGQQVMGFLAGEAVNRHLGQPKQNGWVVMVRMQ